MLTKFSEGLGGKLAEQWIATVLTPAFAFWCGGLLAIIYQNGWTWLAKWFGPQLEPLQIAILVVALLGVAASAQIMRLFDHALIRFLEGYWPRWLGPLRTWLVTRQNVRHDRAEEQFQTVDRMLRADSDAGHTGLPTLLEEYVALDWSLRRVPSLPEQRMPTRLGNCLRAAERLPFDKYGLDAVICWPRLWLLLPGDVRVEVSAAREQLDAAARLWLWGLLFIVWTIWAWWAAPVGILVILVSSRWMLNAAAVYGDLVEASFDLHRQKLYEALRWPLPQSPAEEAEKGKALSEYLWRGSDQLQPVFSAVVKK